MSRRKQSGSEVFVAARQSSSSLANFLALVSGMVTTLIICMMIWMYFSGRSESTKALTETNPDSNRQLDGKAMAIANAEQLETVLIKFNEWNRKADISLLLSQNEDRVRVANQMLQLPLSSSQRNLAINSKIEALGSIYGLDFLHSLNTPDIGATLIATAKSHLADPNKKIVQTSKLAIIKVDTFEFIKSKGRLELEPVLNQMTDVLMENPDDQLVISTIELLVSTLARFERSVGLKTMNHLADSINLPDATETMKFIRTLSDRKMLVEANYDRQFANRWVNGDAGQKALLQTSIQLANDSTGGTVLVNDIGNVAHWFEQFNQYAEAREIYEALIDSAITRQDPAASAAASRLGMNGICRCDLVNQKLIINGKTITGQAINPENFQDRVLVLIFWSANVPSSLTAMSEFHTSSSNLVNSKKIKVLAVCVDKVLNRNVEAVVKTIPNYYPLFIDTNQENSILTQCPITKVPHALVINHFGEITDVNVPFDELQATSEYLSTRRFDSK